jgi:apolipoprotein N-acyltransferase
MSYDPNPTHYAYPVPQQDVRAPRHGLGVAAMILGIIGALFGLIPLTFFVAIVCGVLALVLGLLARKHGMGKAGVVLGVIAVALGIWGAVIVNQAAHEFNKDVDCINNAQTSQQLDACN